jgi:hypothetical protein
VKNLAIRQAVVLPLSAMLAPMLVGLFIPDYSVISQHMSELELLSHPVALLTRIAAIVAGGSIMVFGLGMAQRRHVFTALTALAFGISMVSNGVFVMGGPLHGLYGVGIFGVLVSAFFAVETGRARTLCMAVAIINLLYMWLLFTGLDPDAYKGLTQRLGSIVMFGWYNVAAYILTRPAGPGSPT